MEWASLILGIVKAIPAVEKIYKRSIDLYYAELNARDINNVNKVREQREALLASLKAPGLTDENRANIRRILYTLSKL